LDEPPNDVTHLLAEIRRGNRDAVDRLLPLIYAELRYFGGLNIDETAQVLGVGTSTIERSWRTARAWPWRELSGGEPR
jgi:hypothetical protein